MSVKLHRQAEALMGEADILTARGQVDEAKKRWLEAAHLEAEVFTQVPEDRVKTRGIIAVSTVELFRRAARPDEAVLRGLDYLETTDLPEAARVELVGQIMDLLKSMFAHAETRPWSLFEMALRSDVDRPGHISAATAGLIRAEIRTQSTPDRIVTAMAEEAQRIRESETDADSRSA